MKHFLVAVLFALSAAAQAQSGDNRLVEAYDSGSVAAGAAIDSGVINTSRTQVLTVTVSKGDATSRALTVTFFRADGTTVQGTWAATACAATTCFYNIGLGASGGTASMAMALPPKVSVSLAAGGAVAARVVVIARARP